MSSAKTTLMRTSDLGVQEIKDLSELEKRIYNLVISSANRVPMYLNPSSGLTLSNLRLYIGVFERKFQLGTEDEGCIYREISKFSNGGASQLYVLPNLDSSIGGDNSEVESAIIGRKEQEGYLVLEYGETFEKPHEDTIRRYLQKRGYC